MSSFDFDDLLSLSDDVNLQNESKQCSMLYDNVFDEVTSSSFETDQYQLSTLSDNSSSTRECQLSYLECRVCGAPAHGYNFDQITCEPCKAFFRRNAFRDMSQLKCQFSGSCIINSYTRRQCTYCRLKKCFDIKMCKELILTEEEKQSRHLIRLAKEQLKKFVLSNDQQSLITLSKGLRKKKKHLIIKSTNQEHITNSIYKMYHFNFNSILYDEDRILLNNINNAYQLTIDKYDYSYVNKYTSLTSLIQFMNDENVMYESLINFFKHIPEFKQLDIDDQIILIKTNLLIIIHLHHVIVYNFQDCTNLGNHMSKWINEDFHYQMVQIRRYFYRFMNYPLLLELALLVFMFSINLSALSDINQSYEYKNKKILFHFQNYYTNILWRYLNYLFDEKQAIESMQIIVMQILRYQLLMITMKNSIQQNPDCNKFHVLMQSVFEL
ncbi:unnamed protein product [Rotaria sp. Silwood1]|nr:unnamed protein product [Rotaria sp. Silwood1]